MDNPQIKLWNWFTLLCGLIGIISAFFPLSSMNMTTKLYIAFACFIVGSVYLVYSLIVQFNKLRKDYIEIQTNHKALSEQFDTKSKTLEEYEYSFDTLNSVIIMSLTQNSERETNQIMNFYKVLMVIREKINGGK